MGNYVLNCFFKTNRMVLDHIKLKIWFSIILIFMVFIPFGIQASTNFFSSVQKDTIESKGVVYTYPTPDELLEVVDKENIRFYNKYLNPPENSNKYIHSFSKNLNLGIYLSDIGYASFFSKRNKIAGLIETINMLSTNLLISNELRNNFRNDIERNIDNLDSIYYFTNHYYTGIMRELEKNNINHTMVIINTGAYIESIYLALSLVESYSTDNEIVKKIAEQKNAFVNLNQVSNLYIKNDYVKSILPYQERVIDIYKEFKTEGQGKVILIKNEDGSVNLKSGEKVTMTKEQFDELKKVISEIRAEITKN